MKAVVQNDGALGKMISILIHGDPYPVYVEHTQLELEGAPPTAPGGNRKMTTTETTEVDSPKELRRKAKALKIAGYQEMGKDELAKAVATAEKGASSTKARSKATPAKTTPAKKAPAKKAAAAKAPAAKKAPAKKGDRRAPARGAEGPNPFRPNTNLWHVTQALIKGGKRQTMINSLKSKLSFNPRKQSEADFDVEEEIDRRLKVVGYLLKNKYGFTYEASGRGRDGKIQVTPPTD